MDKNFYQWESIVRDYELDSQGIVNNATYVNYFEQARNNYGRQHGIDVGEYYRMGYTLVVAGIEVNYRLPLKAQQTFYVTCKLSHYDDKRIYFTQEILPSQTISSKPMANATASIACIDQKTGRACMPEIIKTKLDEILLCDGQLK